MKVIKSVGRVLAPYDADGAIGYRHIDVHLDVMGTNYKSVCFMMRLLFVLCDFSELFSISK